MGLKGQCGEVDFGLKSSKNDTEIELCDLTFKNKTFPTNVTSYKSLEALTKLKKKRENSRSFLISWMKL